VGGLHKLLCFTVSKGWVPCRVEVLITNHLRDFVPNLEMCNTV
jgi:hypothetical protein